MYDVAFFEIPSMSHPQLSNSGVTTAYDCPSDLPTSSDSCMTFSHGQVKTRIDDGILADVLPFETVHSGPVHVGLDSASLA